MEIDLKIFEVKQDTTLTNHFQEGRSSIYMGKYGAIIKYHIVELDLLIRYSVPNTHILYRLTKDKKITLEELEQQAFEDATMKYDNFIKILTEVKIVGYTLGRNDKAKKLKRFLDTFFKEESEWSYRD